MLNGTRPRGKKGKSLLMFSGAIQAADLKAIVDNIEEGCEKVDADEW